MRFLGKGFKMKFIPDPGHNCHITWIGTQLIISIETDETKIKSRVTHSGKAVLLATSNGWLDTGLVSINLAVTRWTNWKEKKYKYEDNPY
jgi:hypothetical protein